MKKIIAGLLCLPATAFAHETGFIHSHVTDSASATSIVLAVLLFCFLYKKL